MCLLECASVSGRNDTQPWDSGNGSEGRLRSHSDRGSQVQKQENSNSWTNYSDS